MPARASGNDGQARPAVMQSMPGRVPTLERGRPSDGGAWGYWFCDPRNKATGVWDEEFLRWQHTVLRAVHGAAELRQTLLGELTEADPGAFVRCLWAWMFALDPLLLTTHSDLAIAVRVGSAITPSLGHRRGPGGYYEPIHLV